MTQVPERLLNADFNVWAAGAPSNWTQVSTANTVLVQLDNEHPNGHAERAVMQDGSRGKGSRYIYSGKSSARYRLTTSDAVGDCEIRQGAAAAAGYRVAAGQRYAVKVVGRNSVPNNLLLVGIVAKVGVTDTALLRPLGGDAYLSGRSDFEFAAGSTLTNGISAMLKDQWTEHGFQFEVPAGIDGISVRLANGTTGTQDLDLGLVSLLSIDSRLSR